MNTSVSSAYAGYATLTEQIDILIQQRDNLARVLFDDIKRRLSAFSTMQIPEELTFLNAEGNIPRGEWNRARWELTDMVDNLFKAWLIVSSPDATHIEIQMPEEAPVFFIAAQGPNGQRVPAILPNWIMELEPEAVADAVRDKIAAAEREKYPQA